jgi:hypothetical protein
VCVLKSGDCRPNQSPLTDPLEPFQLASLPFKSYMPIGSIVIALAPKVGQVLGEIDEIETGNSVSIYLLHVS